MSMLVSRLLRHSGCSWTVVCADDGTKPDPGLDGLPGSERLRRIVIPFREKPLRLLVRRALGRMGKGEILERPDIYSSWIPAAARTALEALERGQSGVLATFASPMSCHLAGLRVKQRMPSLRWIAYFGDPWARNPMATRGRLSERSSERMEARVIEAADLLVFPCEEAARHSLERYRAGTAAKARIATHGYEESLFPAPSTLQAGGDLVFSYLGGMYASRGPGPLLDALSALARKSPSELSGVRVRLIGRGVVESGSLPVGIPPGLISFSPEVPYRESLRLMRESDALLLLDPSSPGSGVFLPSKLIDYIGAGRPLLGLCQQGASARILGEMKAWVAPLGDVEASACALAALLEFIRARDRGAHWGDSAVRSRYSAEEAGRTFMGLVKSLEARRR